MFKRTLHEAMRKILLEQPDQTATTSLIADEIDQKRLYLRGDGHAAGKKQIGARARKYPELFAFVAPQTIKLVQADA